MTKYFLFANNRTNDRVGGWYDFQGLFDELETAVASATHRQNSGVWDWWHVVELKQGGEDLAADEYGLGPIVADSRATYA